MSQEKNLDSSSARQRGCRTLVQGRVQGVGFRPFVYRLAHECGLFGHVRNTSQGVEIEIHGEHRSLERFLERIALELPPLARITSLSTEEIPPRQDLEQFTIRHSQGNASHSVLISPDIAACPDCLAEIRDPKDRRFRYPFTNCTNCGPRFSITGSIPYDRPGTSMACFPMCPSCEREYHDPLNRRFHAQPNACPDCGPKLWSADSEGRILANGDEALRGTLRDLVQGRIAAIKGLGGFHLACAGDDPAAVAELRRRKKRPDKPLALMVPDTRTLAGFCRVPPEAGEWLTGTIRPIVLLPRRKNALPGELAPDTADLGVMLPYTPLHSLLLSDYADLLGPERIPALVMTSGNRSDEPIALGNREALRELAGIADIFLLHNRDILLRCDDSVLRPLPGEQPPLLYRRARGFVPDPIPLVHSGKSVLGLGADSKSTICLSKGSRAFVSQHIGDLSNPETLGFYREVVEHAQRIHDAEPELIATDLHPDYESTRHAAEFPHLPRIRVQHHVAHVLSVLAENKVENACLGLALDGTGLGEDGTLWGGELFQVDCRHRAVYRLAHFRRAPVPGGDRAVQEPWRMALSYLLQQGIDADAHPWPWLTEHSRAQVMVTRMLESGINSPPSSSCGRLFDAVAALLGLAHTISYEGQAAVRLEAIQAQGPEEGYHCPVDAESDPAILDTGELFFRVYRDWARGEPPEAISRRFHLGLCRGLARLVRLFAGRTGLRRIALSGGVLQNTTMSTLLPSELEQQGLIPLQHTCLPPNDACISLGQVAYARSFA
jgi:hydrogenase maturation protein HypF